MGAQVTIVGAGDIGFDVAAFLVAAPSDGQQALGEWLAEWGVDLDNSQPGGLREPAPTQPARQVWLLQRKPRRPRRAARPRPAAGCTARTSGTTPCACSAGWIPEDRRTRLVDPRQAAGTWLEVDAW